jgi:hypothetical protein
MKKRETLIEGYKVSVRQQECFLVICTAWNCSSKLLKE